MNSLKAKYIIWDFDGTLAHRTGFWSDTLADVARSLIPGNTMTRPDIRAYVQSGWPWHHHDRIHPPCASSDEWWERIIPVMEQAYRSAGIQSDDDVRRLARAVRARYLDRQYWRVFGDTIPCLTELKRQGWRQLVLSNHVPELQELMADLGLAPYFERIFNSADTGCEKPNPRAFRNVLDALEAGATVWMIGDNVKADILGAAAAGIPAILVRRVDPAAPLCCEDLRDLPAMLLLEDRD